MCNVELREHLSYRKFVGLNLTVGCVTTLKSELFHMTLVAESRNHLLIDTTFTQGPPTLDNVSTTLKRLRRSTMLSWKATSLKSEESDEKLTWKERFALAANGYSIIAKWECHLVSHPSSPHHQTSPHSSSPTNTTLTTPQCHTTTKIKDWNIHWTHCGSSNNNSSGDGASAYPCSNTQCAHERCNDCFDLNSENWQIQHCDGRDCKGAGLWDEEEIPKETRTKAEGRERALGRRVFGGKKGKKRGGEQA